MKAIAPGQLVRYVTASNETVDGVILEVVGALTARVEYGDRHQAFADFSPDKERNTFHFEDEPADSEKPQPFTPGTASPDKPTTGADAPSPVT